MSSKNWTSQDLGLSCALWIASCDPPKSPQQSGMERVCSGLSALHTATAAGTEYTGHLEVHRLGQAPSPGEEGCCCGGNSAGPTGNSTRSGRLTEEGPPRPQTSRDATGNTQPLPLLTPSESSVFSSVNRRD